MRFFWRRDERPADPADAKAILQGIGNLSARLGALEKTSARALEDKFDEITRRKFQDEINELQYLRGFYMGKVRELCETAKVIEEFARAIEVGGLLNEVKQLAKRKVEIYENARLERG